MIASAARAAGLRTTRSTCSGRLARWPPVLHDAASNRAARRGSSPISARYHDAYVGQPRTHGRLHHVAYVGERPVACSTLLFDEGLATVWDVATAPDQRRRGYGAALVRALIEEALRAGCRHASLNTSRLGRSMYRSLGFDLEVAIPEFSWTPPSA